ncbi:hypothetical protein [Bacillus massilinigeriensis]|uniref:hypothetical protein n=1 Tax=Bacillus mediterraneensis TaxID=1805474 RepID=UPI00114D494C|nr:hypothetical protein [Bacillus mediterraneensis]
MRFTVDIGRVTVDKSAFTVDKSLFTVDRSLFTVDRLPAIASSMAKSECVTGYSNNLLNNIGSHHQKRYPSNEKTNENDNF